MSFLVKFNQTHTFCYQNKA